MALLYFSLFPGRIQLLWLWNIVLSIYSIAMKSFAATSSNGSQKIGRKIGQKLKSRNFAITTHQPALQPQTQLNLPSKATAPIGDNNNILSNQKLSTSSSNGNFFSRFFSTENKVLRKQLVLDLDETLICTEVIASNPLFVKHSFSFKTENHGTFNVRKRPHVDHFLTTVAQWYEVSIFTASIKPYANPIIDHLDPHKTLISRRYFRDSAKQQRNGLYVKELKHIYGDLSKVLIVDNLPLSYETNKENGIDIKTWLGDQRDEALLELLPLLEKIKDSDMDVRESLKLYSNKGNKNKDQIKVIIR